METTSDVKPHDGASGGGGGPGFCSLSSVERERNVENISWYNKNRDLV